MGDAPRLREMAGGPPGVAAPVVVEVPGGPRGLPLAAARNAGARVALDSGADVVIFLDVDCLPAPRLVARYGAAAVITDAARATTGPSLLCGPVSYLPPPPPDGYPAAISLADLGAPHPARPAPPDGQLQVENCFELFWSLSFAVSATAWAALGGFHEGYVGYGAEDTDFACRAEAAGASLYWVGGAEAYHQYHPPSRHDPRKVGEMIRNAQLFHSRHGWWPMQAWLEDLAALGHLHFDPGAGRLERLPRPGA
jgi:GT2 family glycosyltransferase